MDITLYVHKFDWSLLYFEAICLKIPKFIIAIREARERLALAGKMSKVLNFASYLGYCSWHFSFVT